MEKKELSVCCQGSFKRNYFGRHREIVSKKCGSCGKECETEKFLLSEIKYSKEWYEERVRRQHGEGCFKAIKRV